VKAGTSERRTRPMQLEYGVDKQPEGSRTAS
jgi:hypothetical protein